MTTNHGDITFELFDEDAPKTVDNFRKLARDGFYDGLIFHRVIKDFMVQGGCPQGTGTGGPGYTFEDEINQHKVVRGALAMANAGPNTNGSQFFIVTTEAARGWTASTPSSARSPTGWTSSTDRGPAHRPPRPPAGGRAHREARSRGLGSSAWPPSPRPAPSIPVENPATGEVIAHRPGHSAATRSRRWSSAPARRSRRWEALGFEGRAKVFMRAQKWPSTTPTRIIGDDRRGDRQDARGRAARRGHLRRQRVRLLGQARARVPGRRAASSRPTRSYWGASSRALPPVGVVGVIGPWNFPLTNSFGDCIPALAAGNAVVLKPSRGDAAHVAADGGGAARVRDARRVFQVATGGREAGEALIDASTSSCSPAPPRPAAR